MRLNFVKMQGLGNDFVMIDAMAHPVILSNEQLRHLADRRFGVGCDQILFVEPSQIADVDFRYRIFNADGGEVQQCGNGARCFARFVHDQGLTDKTEIVVETQKGLIYPRIEADGEVTVNMGLPRFTPAEIPFLADAASIQYPIELSGKVYQISVVSMGNPHAVLVVDSVDTAPTGEVGVALESHPRFPERVNVGFMQVMDRHSIRLRVFERGSGETLACGTGACAAVVAGQRLGLLDEGVSVQTRGGSLTIRWAGENQPVLMRGAAVRVFEGVIEL
jgi:diaminopimelate epimerase